MTRRGSGGLSRATWARPTMDDVAAMAGVSRGTVSRVLSGGGYVSQTARRAVERAVEESGYVVNQHARTLASQRSGSVAFVLNESQERLFDDPTFPALVRSCTQALAQREITVVMTVAGTTETRRRVGRYVSSGHVDGVMLSCTHAGDPLVDELLARRVPTVVYGRPLYRESELCFVAVDDRDGARQAVQHLLARGRRRIGHITGSLDTAGGRDRLAGYRETLGDLADPALVATGDYTRAGGGEAMCRLLAQTPDIDAVFAASDVMAAGALDTLRRSGRCAPCDVSVVGFDDCPLAATTEPPLTTIRQPLCVLGDEMVRLLLQLVDGEPAQSVTVATTLVVRGSS